MESKVLSLIGLAYKSRNLVSGDDTVLKELKKGTIKLVIIAADSSENTKKKFRDKCSYRNVQMIEFSTKEDLGKAMGKEFRGIIGIKEKNFSQRILELLGGEAFVKDKSI